MSGHETGSLQASMKCVAAILRENDVPYALAGSLAVWARGGPDVSHDVDFVILPDDRERVLTLMEDAGMRTEKPPPDWLYKAYDGDNLIDFIFYAPTGTTSAYIENAEELVVESVRMPVMTVDDVLIMKLAAMNELCMDYAYLLQLARSTREQINWEYVERSTKGNVFADAFFLLASGVAVKPAS
jgi:hypothetical protein